MKKTILYFLALSMMISCQETRGPDETLRNFITYRFAGRQEISKVKSYLTGKLLDKVSLFTQKEQESFLDTKGLSNKGFKILLRKCSDTLCNITYQLKYAKSDQGKTDFLGEVKKIAELTLIGESSWKISNIEEVKTYFEYKKALDL